MATRNITTRIALDGEAEFKKQMSAVNGELKNLKSEMGLVTAEFKDNADSTEALTAKSQILRKEIDQQEEKVRALEQAVKDSTEAYGEADAKTDKYKQALNKAKAELIDMNRELKETDAKLEDVSRGFDDARKGAEKADGAFDDLGGSLDMGGGMIDDFAGKLSGLGIAGVAGAAVAGIGAIVSAIGDVVESTAEYRKIMGTLEVSSAAAGYTAEETAEAYNYLFAVLGDDQSTATTIANLQAMNLEQDTLLELIDSVVGAWGTYGDSIPIDGLAEAINETVKVGQVTGTFANVLNWAGLEEDAFNERLSAMQTEGSRVHFVMRALADLDLPDAGKAWREVNADIVATNEATQRLEAATAKLGETLSPIQAKITEFKAAAVEALDVAVNWGLDLFNAQTVSDSVSWWKDHGSSILNPTASNAAGGYAAAGSIAVQQSQEIVLNVTETIDGAVLARNQYRYNTREGQLRGGSLVEGVK